MNSFAALDSDNEDEVVVVVQKPKKEAKVAPVVAAVVAPVKAAAASSSKPVKAAGGNGPPKAPKGRFHFYKIQTNTFVIHATVQRESASVTTIIEYWKY